MNTAIYNIELKEGVKVAMLFTPRLYTFKDTEGVTFETQTSDMIAMHSLYADIMYCAALNYWTLTHPADEEFQHHRLDFHSFSVTNRKSFEKAMIFAVETLSGKSVRELAESRKEREEMGKNEESQDKAETVKKKSAFGWIMSRLRRS